MSQSGRELAGSGPILLVCFNMACASSPLLVEIVPAAQLSLGDQKAWLAIQASHPDFASPLLGAGFAMAVGRARTDAFVAVYRREGQAVGFFAHHRRPGGFARPIGAPFSDYQAIVAKADAFGRDDNPIALAGLRAFRHNGLIDPYGLFPVTEGDHEAFSIELSGTSEDYLECARARSPKRFKNYRRLQHRLAELGTPSLRAETRRDSFETLMRWKSEQFVRTGTQDVLRPAWVMTLMRDLLGIEDGAMRGLMLNLYVGDRLAGGHFGIRQGDVYHPWIASMDPELTAFSPGNAFLDEAIRAMPALGLAVYDLGVGHDHYKRPFSSTVKIVTSGLQSAPGTAGALSRAGERAWRVGALGRSSVVDKVRRRLDHIATTDPSIKGRVHGLIEAVAATRRRPLGLEH